jgi:hypothetical protein
VASFSGAYSVTATLNGCTSAPATVNVVVNGDASIGAYASPNDTICLGTTAFFQSFPINAGTAPAFRWYKNGAPIPGATSTMLSTADLVTGDKIHCTMTVNGICSTPYSLSTTPITMTVLPVVTTPIATIKVDNVLFNGVNYQCVFKAELQHGGTAPKYQWTKNGQKVHGATYATWVAGGLNRGDKINVEVESDDPCATNKNAASDTLIIGIGTGINNTSSNESIAIYPNPNNGNFTIEGIKTNTPVQLSITNTLGQSVYSSELKPENGKLNLSTSGLPSGTYMLRLNYNNQQQTLKFNME